MNFIGGGGCVVPGEQQAEGIDRRMCLHTTRCLWQSSVKWLTSWSEGLEFSHRSLCPPDRHVHTRCESCRVSPVTAPEPGVCVCHASARALVCAGDSAALGQRPRSESGTTAEPFGRVCHRSHGHIWYCSRNAHILAFVLLSPDTALQGGGRRNPPGYG